MASNGIDTNTDGGLLRIPLSSTHYAYYTRHLPTVACLLYYLFFYSVTHLLYQCWLLPLPMTAVVSFNFNTQHTVLYCIGWFVIMQ